MKWIELKCGVLNDPRPLMGTHTISLVGWCHGKKEKHFMALAIFSADAQ